MPLPLSSSLPFRPGARGATVRATLDSCPDRGTLFLGRTRRGLKFLSYTSFASAPHETLWPHGTATLAFVRPSRCNNTSIRLENITKRDR